MTTSALSVRPHPENVETGIATDVRKQLVADLSNVLGDTYLLLVKTHVYHWNVVGPLFLPLHNLTEEHYKDLFAAADTIAERIRSLGYAAPLSFESMEEKTRLHEETSNRTAQQMIEQLVADHEQMVRHIRSTTSSAASSEDYVTHDMLNARLAFHEKAIWMLRAIVA